MSTNDLGQHPASWLFSQSWIRASILCLLSNQNQAQHQVGQSQCTVLEPAGYQQPMLMSICSWLHSALVSPGHRAAIQSMSFSSHQNLAGPIETSWTYWTNAFKYYRVCVHLQLLTLRKFFFFCSVVFLFNSPTSFSTFLLSHSIQEANFSKGNCMCVVVYVKFWRLRQDNEVQWKCGV